MVRGLALAAAVLWTVAMPSGAAAHGAELAVLRGWVPAEPGIPELSSPEILVGLTCTPGEDARITAVVGQPPAAKAVGSASVLCSGEAQVVLVGLVGELVPGAAFWRVGVVFPGDRAHEGGRGEIVLAGVTT